MKYFCSIFQFKNRYQPAVWKIRNARRAVDTQVDDMSCVLRKLIERSAAAKPETDVIKIKVSGDGHFCGKFRQYLTFTAHIVGSQKIDDLVLLKIQPGDESYNAIKAGGFFQDFYQKHVKEVFFGGKLYPVQYFFGGDLKFILSCLGMKAANSLFACVYCHCEKKNWHLCFLPDSGCRLKFDLGTKKMNPMTAGDPGMKPGRECLVDFDVFQFVVIDLMHMFFRITDQIFSRTLSLASQKGLAEFQSMCDAEGISSFYLKTDGIANVTFSKLTTRVRRILLKKVFLRDNIAKIVGPGRKAEQVTEIYVLFRQMWATLY